VAQSCLFTCPVYPPPLEGEFPPCFFSSSHFFFLFSPSDFCSARPFRLIFTWDPPPIEIKPPPRSGFHPPFFPRPLFFLLACRILRAVFQKLCFVFYVVSLPSITTRRVREPPFLGDPDADQLRLKGGRISTPSVQLLFGVVMFHLSFHH